MRWAGAPHRDCKNSQRSISQLQPAWREAARVSFRMRFPEDFDMPGVPKAWREAPRVSFRTCYAEDFDIPGAQKACLEAPGVSFHTCFTEDFDKGMA